MNEMRTYVIVLVLLGMSLVLSAVVLNSWWIMACAAAVMIAAFLLTFVPRDE